MMRGKALGKMGIDQGGETKDAGRNKKKQLTPELLFSL